MIWNFTGRKMDQSINSSYLNFESFESPDLCIGRISCFDGILHQNCVGLSATNMKLHVVHETSGDESSGSSNANNAKVSCRLD